MKKVKLLFAGLEVEFADREKAISQLQEWVEKGTWQPVVIYGPEGCGKTTLLRQAAQTLEEAGYALFYLHPLDRVFHADIEEPDIRKAFLELAQRALSEDSLGRVAWAVFDFIREALKRRRRKIAVLADDVFQVIGVQYAAAYVKGLLNMIEHPLYHYENIVVLVATSEGVSRGEIGRHRWADLRAMWNMSIDGFKQLYDKLPSPRPPLEEAWRWTGGNPWMLARLYQAGWDKEAVTIDILENKKLIPSFIEKWRTHLAQAVEDPDALWSPDTPDELINSLTERNLIVYNMHSRLESRWVDQPPPERDPELGIGRHVAWQTPLHREAVKKALENSK